MCILSFEQIMRKHLPSNFRVVSVWGKEIPTIQTEAANRCWLSNISSSGFEQSFPQ